MIYINLFDKETRNLLRERINSTDQINQYNPDGGLELVTFPKGHPFNKN